MRSLKFRKTNPILNLRGVAVFVVNTADLTVNFICLLSFAGTNVTDGNQEVSETMNIIDGSTTNIDDQATRLQCALDGAQTAIMMVDRDFIVTYANQATMDLLAKYKTEFLAAFPKFDPSALIGACIDMFHKHPAHQRNLLDDVRNLPHQTDISIGDLKFSLNVTAMIDAGGKYVGNTLEWSDVTALRNRENHVARLQGSVDASMQAMIMVDRDFIVTYANQATQDLLTKYRTELSAAFPGFDPAALEGVCIDMFHKNPAHQRKLMDDPKNLPFQTDISIGDLKFSLNVTAIIDAEGKYVGNTLEWADVTALRSSEVEISRLTSAVTGAETALMLCDSDLNITFVNKAVVSLLNNRAQELRQIFPGIDPNNLIGVNIDQFHKNPAHQRSLLADVNRLPARSKIRLLDLVFEVNATAILGPNGEYMGNMVEWQDLTEQSDAEAQLEKLIAAAVAGDLDQRIDTSTYSGFMKGLGDQVNSMMQAIVAPIRESTRVIQSLAEGDLTKSMTGEFQGEFAVLSEALNDSTTKLQQMMAEITLSAGNISSGAGEISQGNADLSQRTEEQASSIEETASTMEEMTSVVKQNADNARQANQLASGARQQAEKGGDVVSNAVTAMSEINASSKKIEDIISVIDEIAFQTNLLALNAAVEAARAGEQGRGFAVVAGEVRSLAQRSAAAAKEIKGLIKDSVGKVEEGSRLVDESGKTLEEIVVASKKVSDIIAEIAAAGQEQATGIDQINKAITQLESVTQQNAALVEEAAAASESMANQSVGLQHLVGQFTIDESYLDQGGAPAPASRRTTVAKPAVARRAAAPAATRTRPAPNSDGDEWEEF